MLPDTYRSPQQLRLTPGGGAESAQSDTLIKRGMHIDATLVRERTEHVTQAVQDDLRHNTRYANRIQFLNNFFPDNKDFQQVFEKLKNRTKALYDAKESRWTALPDQPLESETEYYQPLENLCNSISQAYCKHTNSAENRTWLDRHSKKPTSFTNAAENRPDLVNVYHDGLEQGLKNHIKTLEEDTSRMQTRRMTRAAEKAKEGTVPSMTAQESKNLIAYWCRVAVAFEVKPKQFTNYSSEEVQKTIIQLAGYMRQMLREQHDRHFVFGLILFHDQLSVWYCDRSGLLGMKDLIDVHKEPMLFVRVISSLSTLSPKDMGWDPTMKLYRPDGRHIPSHELAFDEVLGEFKESAYLYRTQWVIEVKGKTYVTIEALSLYGAEVMCGRAQLVWVAADVTARKIVVIKQSWSPYSTKGQPALRSEASIYHRTDEKSRAHIGQLEHDEVVFGTRTVENFRKSIPSFPLPITDIKFTFTEQKSGDQILHQQTTSMADSLSESAVPLTERQLCRMVFKDYGYPLKCFCSLRELLETLLQCLIGYQALLENGIVHRDISPGNLLICPKDFSAVSFDPRTCVGRINDLDHGKFDPGYKKGCKMTVETLCRDLMEEEKIDLQSYFSKTLLDPSYRRMGISLDPYTCETIVLLAHDPQFYFKAAISMEVPDATGYLRELVTSLKMTNKWKYIQEEVKQRAGRQLSLRDLHFISVTDSIAPPTFDSRTSENEERSGTLPFMSYRLLTPKPDDVPHTAIHDMESFLWVVMHIVWQRDGPGGHTRSLRSPESPVRRLVHHFLDGSAELLSRNKELLFATPEDFANRLLPHIHPYFEPLKPMLREWWRIIHFSLARSNHWKGGEYVLPHIGFRRAVEECLKSLGQTDGHTGEGEAMANEEIQRRILEHRNYMQRLDSICNGQEPLPA